MADDVTHYDAVEGYCGQLSYLPGDTVGVHVRCTRATFDIDVRRWGGEVLWRGRDIDGVEQPTPINADAQGCGWAVSATIPTSSSWISGMYLVTLAASDAPGERMVSHAMFVLRAGARHNTTLLVLATNTYNAYNNWGGKSLYTGGKQVSFDRPFGRGVLVREHTERDDRKARPRWRGEEPDVEGTIYQRFRHERGYPAYIGSAGWFTYERRFAEWLEAAGGSVDYAISSDLHDPSALDGYALVLSVGHDEYWSGAQRDTLEAHIARGGNFASFSGNTMFWQVRLEDDGHTMVCHKYTAHLSDPVVGTDQQHAMTGMWCDPLVGRPETEVLGAGSAWGLYSRFGSATARGSGAFTVYRDQHWMLANTGLRYGDLLGADDGVVGYETVGCRLGLDEYQLPIAAGGDGTPAEMEIVAFTPSSNLAMGEYPRSIAALNDQGDLEFVASRLHGRVDADSLARHRYGNAVMLTCRPHGSQGGQVATIGSTDWVFGLNDPIVAQVTSNVLTSLGQTSPIGLPSASPR